ncbi:hypothetical protein BGZ94_005622 [Podila epigama]|nr:hypothetical protein BGZ94_005622 [Podila epigama]
MAILSVLEKTTHQQSVASLTVTFLAIITYGFYKSWLYPYHLAPLSRLPGPVPSKIPFLGNMLDMTRKKPMMALYDWAMEYPGSLIRYYWFSRLTLLTSDPVTVGYVLGKGNDNWLKSKETEQQFDQNLGHSLLSMKSHEHSAHRKYLLTAFKHSYLKSMTIAFQGVAQDLIEVWRTRLARKGDESDHSAAWERDGKVFRTIDLEPSFYCLTLDSIGQFALGRGFDAIQKPIGPDFENYKIIVESFQVTLLTLLPFSNWIPTRTNRRAWRAVRGFNQSMDVLVQERKQELMREIEANRGQFSEDEDATSQKKDMLTMLLVDQLSSNGGSDLQIRHDVFTAIFAGHETTSAALSWVFFQLATHPNVQTKLREETRQLYNDVDGNPTYDELNSLPYLNAVIRESLRLWSPVPLNLRVSIEDDYLPRSHGMEPLFVPGGTNLQLPMFILQRDPKIWGPDSLEFKPERWLNPDKSCPPYMPPNGVCYFPFYHGKRSCIGNKIATLEMKTHIANLVNEFEFVPAPDMLDENGELAYRWSISLKPNPGVRLGVRLAE